MNTRTKRVTATGISLGAVAAVIAGVYAFGATAPAADPAPTPTVEVAAYVGTTENGLAFEQEADAAAAEAARIEAERVAAEAAAAAEAARVEAERVAAEEAARQAQESQQRSTGGNTGGGGGTVEAPAAPIRCPGGSLANSSDGVNDTSCMWEVCFSITVPDPAHPECDAAFRP